MWTTTKVFEETAKLTTLQEFRSNKALSSAAYRLGIYKEATVSLDRQVRDNLANMSIEDIKVIAKTYTSRATFTKEHSAMYKMLGKEGLIEVFGKYRAPLNYTDDYLLNTARKYSTRGGLKKELPNIYNLIRKRNLQNIVFAHMESPKCVKYTEEELRHEAIKYTTKNTFKLKNYGMYQAACKHPAFDSICSHMLPGTIATNYNKPMFLYIVKITTIATSDTVYKVGITKRSYILDRFWVDYNKCDTSIEVLAKTKFNLGRDAYDVEQYIKQQFKVWIYTGASPLLRTKTTEMFTKNITYSELDRKVDTNV